MNWPLLAVILVVGGIVAWSLARGQSVFVGRFRKGRAEAARGKVTDAFLSEVADVFREFGLSSAEVCGVARGRRIALRFSRSVPPSAR